MNRDLDIDRAIAEWLDLGPEQLPDQVLDRVAADLEETRQRAPAWRPERILMNRFGIGLAAAAAAVVITAAIGVTVLTNFGGAPAPDQPSPSASWVTFTSDRYAYSIEHPADWRVREQPGGLVLNGMQIGSPGTDVIGPPEYFSRSIDDGVVVVSAHELDGDESLQDFSSRVSREAACGGGSFDRQDTSLDGEPAEFRKFECEVWDWIQITAIHGDRGYVVWAVATQPPAAHERAINDQMLASFHFTN